jgi:hypothetical integral membrane protein (TIGR02206 family)
MNPPLNILAPGPWETFVPYGGLHAIAFAICALLIAAPSLIGRTLSESAEISLRRGLAAFAICYWIAYNVWWNWHGLDPRTGLPLQICDVNGLLAPLVLLTRWRWAQATLYFWTAALTLQAFVQPALRAGPATPIFWAFWIAHTIIFASAVYDIVVLGFRPTWRDLGRAVIASAVYIAVVLPVDVSLGANYGFLGNPADPSEVPPFIDALGPWPLRAIIVIALAPAGFAVVLSPWLIAARLGNSRARMAPAASDAAGGRQQ